MMLDLFFLSNLVSLEVRMKKYGRKYIYISLPRLSCNIPQTQKYYWLLELGGLSHVKECLKGGWFQRTDLYSLIFGLIQLIKEPVLLAAILCHMREWARTPWSCEKNHPEYDYTSIQYVKSDVPQLEHCHRLVWRKSQNTWICILREIKTPIRSGAPRTRVVASMVL